VKERSLQKISTNAKITVLALATMDTATQNRTNSTCVTAPKVVKASKADILMVKMGYGLAYKFY
jgi:hypothetical protein